MRKLTLLVVVLIVAAVSLASVPIKMATEKLAVYVNPPLDATGVPVETSDSMWVMTWSDNGTATRYEARSTTAPFSDIGFDTTLALFAGSTNLRYVYNQTISTIDGTAGNFLLAGTITAFTAGIPTHTNFAVQVVADSLSKAVSLLVAYLDATISSRSTLTTSDNIGINWGDVSNPTTVVGLSGTTILKSSNVDNIASTDTLTTILGNVNGSVGSVTGKVTLVDSSANDIAMVGNAHPTDSTNAANAAASAKAAQDTIVAHAPHDNNWGGTAASSLDSGIVQRIVDNNMTPDTVRTIVATTLGDSLATFGDSAQFARSVWDPDVVATRRLSELDEDNTTIDLDGSTIGTVTNVSDKTGYALTAVYPDSSMLSRVLGRKIWGVAAGTGADSTAKAARITGGSPAGDTINAHAPHGNNWASAASLTDAEIDSIAARTAALIGASQLYPLLDRVALVDAPGAIPKQQFVCDSTSIGGANEYGILNTKVRVKDVDDGKWSSLSIIERMNCTADQCTLQVADSLAFAVEANDSVFFFGAGPGYVQATVYEAATILVDSLLGRDLTGVPQDSLVGGLLKIAALSGGSTFDTTQFLTMWLAHGWYAAMDSLIYRTELGNSNSLPVLADLFTQAEFEAFSMNIGKIKGDTTLVIDTSRNAAGASVEIDSADIAQIAAAVSSEISLGLGGGPLSYQLKVKDTLNAVVVGRAFVGLYNNDDCSGDPVYWGWSNPSTGYFSFAPDTGYYWVCATKPASCNFDPAQPLHITATGVDTIEGYGFASSTRVIATGYVQNPGGVYGAADTVCAYCDYVFELVSDGAEIRDTVLNVTVSKRPIQYHTDQNGYVAVELRKTQNLVGITGTSKYPVKWKARFTTPDGYVIEKRTRAVLNAETTIDIGEW